MAKISFRQVLIEEANFDIEAFDGRDTLAKAAIARVPVEKDSRMSILDNLYNHLARSK